jgi:hypothetical protein
MADSGLIFNPETGLISPDTADIRAGVAADWTAAFADPDQPPLNTEPTTPAGQLIDSETAVIEDKNAQVLYLANQFNPRVSEGRWQDGIGFIYFLERQIETPSLVTCQLTGLSGTAIPAGALVRTTAGLTLICGRAVTIGPSGAAETMFRCSETGPIPIPAHSVTSIVTVTPGWDTVDNEAAGVPGRYRETRSEFERRRFDSVAANAHGTVPSLYGTIANLFGVVDLVILENITNEPVVDWGVTIPAHGVFISVYGGGDTEIAEAIYRKKDAGCDTGGNVQVSYHDATIHNYRGGVTFTYSIERPEPLPFGVRVSLSKTPATPGTVIDDIKRAILADFNGQLGRDRVRMAAICYASRFYCPVSSAGAQNLLNIEIAAPAANGAWVNEITVNADQMPVLSIDDIQVIVVNA